MNEPKPCPCGQAPEPLKLLRVQHISCDAECCAGVDFAAEAETLDEAITLWNLWCEDVGRYVKAEREDLLARLYAMGNDYTKLVCPAVAQLCDEVLDQSGGLLGRVRAKAAAIREGASDDG